MAPMLYFVATLWSLLVATCSAASINLNFQLNAFFSNPSTLPPSTHATLTQGDGTIKTSLIRADNTIKFTNITYSGSSLLSIFTRDYTFASYRIDTSLESPTTSPIVVVSLAAQTFPGSPWSDTGPSLLPQSQSPDGSFTTRSTSDLTLTPRILSTKSFYEARPAFNPLSLLKSPMILLGIVALGFTFGMPYLIENMDPEMRKEYEEMQKKGPTAAVTNAMHGKAPGKAGDMDLAGWLAGQGKKSAA